MNRQRQQGSTMIEVLVTMVILAVGLLGVASMQMVSLKNANSSNQRYLASLYAYDMMERMRSNDSGVDAGNYNAINVNGTENVATCSVACNPAAMATADAFQWGQQLSDNLPSGTGTVAPGADGFVITVSWVEQHTGANIGQAAGVAAASSFQLEVAM